MDGKMERIMKRCCRMAAVVTFAAVCCILLIQPRDPLLQRLPRTYANLMRGPLVMGQGEPILIDVIKKMFHGPSSEPYNLKHPELEDSSQSGQQAYLLDIIGDKRGGTFLEAGAFNGETHSNTLYLERFLDWTGVLVEAEDFNYGQLLLTRRKSKTLNACIAPTAYPQQFGFEHIPGTVVSYVDPDFSMEDLDSQMRLKQCFPLYSILLAANLISLDFLSLDVEGIDHLVLQTVPWHMVDIKIVMVEYVRPGFKFQNGSFDPEFEKPIKKIMLANDYTLVHRLDQDLIFVKNGSEFAVGV